MDIMNEIDISNLGYRLQRRDDGRLYVERIVGGGDDQPLMTRTDLKEHSTNLGLSGEDGKQTALAILADALTDEIALDYHEQFYSEVLSDLTVEDGSQQSIAVDVITTILHQAEQ